MFCKSIEQAQDYARAVYPDLADAAFEFPRQGFEYQVLLTGQDALRMPRRENIVPAMAQEIDTLTRLEGKLPFAIPAVLDYQPDNHIMRTTRVPGAPLSKKELTQMPAAALAIARQIGAFTASLHSALPVGGGDKKSSAYTEWFARDVGEKIAAMESQDCDDFTRQRLAAVKNYLATGLQGGDFVFCHGDLQLPNVLYDGDSQKIGVVDFSKAGPGHVHADLALFYYYPEPMAEAALAAYEQASGRAVDRELVRLHHEAHVISSRKPSDLLESYHYFHQPQPPF